MSDRRPLETACKHYEEDLVLYYYGESNVEDKRRIVEHLTTCRACARFLDDLRGLLPQMTDVEEMPQSFWDRYFREVVAKLEEQDEHGARMSWRSWFKPMQSWMVPAFGTVAVAVFVVGLVVGKGDLRLFTEPRTEGIPQELLVDQNQLQFFRSMDMLEVLGRLESQDDQNTDSSVRDSGRASLPGRVA